MFIAGSPGATQRLLTQDQLMTVRDVVVPMDQLIASELRGRLLQFRAQGSEQAFIARDLIDGLDTLRTGIDLGRLEGLLDAV